ncbi:MAG: apolipoprotein N-acyltransferase [Gammaproteobacteria bacterium]|nr:apolipoprotein N-acyltransferase [Gammaproteobacteria bacterium]
MNPATLLATSQRRYLLAAIAGLLSPLAFAPFNFIPVIFVSLAALFAVWCRSSPREAFRSGFLFGAGMFGVGVSWVYVSMHDFGGVSAPMGVLLTLLFVLFLALFPAIVGWLHTRYFQQPDALWINTLAVSALWTLGEWCRGWIFTGFPWLSIGYSQVDSPLSSIAPILGVFGVSWTVAFVVALLVYARRAALWKITLPVVAVLCVGAYALTTIEWAIPAGTPIKVALLQGNVSQDLKWRPEQRQPTIDWYVDNTRLSWGSDLIIWPETALPVFYHQAQEFLAGLGKEARSASADVFIGMPVMNPRTQQYYNSMVSVAGPLQSYSKQHLVPFGEYIPFASLLGGLMEFMQVPLPDFSTEPSLPVVKLAGYAMGVSICYEDAFGEEVIKALPEATALINTSNDAWFGDSMAPHQHLQIARMSSIETQRPLLRATNTGVTAAIDHRGKVIAQAPQFEAAVLRVSVQPMQGSTLYVQYGNTMLITVLIVLTMVVLLIVRKRKQTVA